MKVFGKSGAALIPMLHDVEALTAKARELGLVVGGEEAKAAAEFTDAWSDVRSQLMMVVFQIGGALAPVLTKLSRLIAPLIKDVIDWVKKNRGLFVALGAVGAALVAAGAAFLGLAVAIKIVVFAFSAALVVVKAIHIALLGLTSPFGLLAAALVGGAVLWAKYMETGRSTMAALGQVFHDTLGGMKDALAAGDLKLAAEILWTGLKLAWMTGTDSLRDVWIDAGSAMLTAWNHVVGGVQTMFVKLIATLKRAWTDFSSFFRTGLKSVGVGFTAAAEAFGLVEKGATGKAAIDLAFDTKREVEGRQGRNAELDRELQQEMDAIGAQLAAAQNANATGAADRKAAAQAEMETLRARMQELRDRAQLGAEEARVRSEKSLLSDENSTQRGTGSGTFNPYAAARLAGEQKRLDEIAVNSKETAKNLQKLLDRMNGNVVFGS